MQSNWPDPLFTLSVFTNINIQHHNHPVNGLRASILIIQRGWRRRCVLLLGGWRCICCVQGQLDLMDASCRRPQVPAEWTWFSTCAVTPPNLGWCCLCFWFHQPEWRLWLTAAVKRPACTHGARWAIQHRSFGFIKYSTFFFFFTYLPRMNFMYMQRRKKKKPWLCAEVWDHPALRE